MAREREISAMISTTSATSLRIVWRVTSCTGFRERFVTDVGHTGLRKLDYVAARERHLQPEQRTR